MNSITKLIIATSSVLFLQSCNMAKRYGNMRINHHEENITNNSSVEIKDESNQVSQAKSPAADCANSPEIVDSIDSSITIVANSESKLISEKQKTKLILPSSNNSKQIKFKKKNILIKKVDKLKSKVTRLKLGSAQQSLTVDEWGYIVIGLAVIAFIILILVTGSFLVALLLALEFFLALISLIAIGMIFYGLWAILNFLGGGFA